MDKPGYHNWRNKSDTYDNDLSETSPPAYSSYGYSAGSSQNLSKSSITRAKSAGNIYDYSIEEDDNSYDSSPKHVNRKSNKDKRGAMLSSTLPSNESSRRKSTEERMKEILERNNADKRASKAVNKPDEIDTNTWKSSWDDLLKGLNSPEGPTHDEETGTKISKTFATETSDGEHSPSDSSFGDFEISASDLEVGTLAAKRAMEKTSDRIQRTMAEEAAKLAKAALMSSPPARPLQSSISPNMQKQLQQQEQQQQQRQVETKIDVKMSTALSAIYKNSNQDSSVDGSKGDNDLYKILAKTNSDRRQHDRGTNDHQKSVDSDFSLGRSSLSGRSSQESSSRMFNRSGDPKEYYDEDKDDQDFDFENEDRGMDNDEGEGKNREGDKKNKNNINDDNNDNNNYKNNNKEEDDEDGAEYSSDDFDHSYDVKETGSSPKNTNTIKSETANNVKTTENKELETEKEKEKDKKVEKLSDEEIDRRKSIELIKQRWLNPVNVSVPVPFIPPEIVTIPDPVPVVPVDPVQVPSVPLVIVEKDVGGEDGDGDGDGGEGGIGVGAGVGGRDVDAKRKSVSPLLSELRPHDSSSYDNAATTGVQNNQEDSDYHDNERDRYDDDDRDDNRSERSDNDTNRNDENDDDDDQDEHQYNRYEDREDADQENDNDRKIEEPDESNTSMMSRYDHTDDDNVLGTGTFHASSRYENPDSTSQSQSQSQSYSQSHNKSMESASVCSQSNDGLIGMRLLTTIGSNSMVTSVPTPFSITTTLPQFTDQRASRSPSVASSPYPDSDRPSDRPGQAFETLNNMGTRLGVADGDMREFNSRHLTQDSTDDLASVLNRRSVTFQSDRVVDQGRQTGQTGEMKGSTRSNPEGGLWRGLQIGVTDNKNNQNQRSGSQNISNISRTSESEIDQERANEVKSLSPSFLNQHEYSHTDPKPIEMFQSQSQGSSQHPVWAPADPTQPTHPLPPRSHASRSNSPIRQSIESHLISSADRAKTPSPFRPGNGKNPPVGPVSWPHELPMSAPSPNELYAQLAMISSAADRRAADLVSVKAKISGQGSKTKSSTPRAQVPANQPALNRLEQGTARLTRQFQSLQAEISNLSLNSTKGRPKDRSPNVTHTHTRSAPTSRADGHSLIPFRSGSSVSRDTNHTVSASKGVYGTSGSSRLSVREERSDKRSRDTGTAQRSSSAGRREGRRNSRIVERYGGSGDYGDEDYPHSDGEGGPGGSLLGPYGETRWGLQALETVQKIVDSGVVLSQREKELRLREEEIRIKEALAYAVFQEQFGSKHVPLGIEEKQGKERESFQKDNVQVLDVVLCKDQSTQQREVELMAEINRLKALLFSISLERDDALAVIENMKAERVALNNEMKKKDEDQHIPPTSFRPYKHIPSYLPAPSDPDSTHTQDGIERITISKSEFETLIAECASQETLITGFQKENEKLLKKVKNRDFEDMNERAKFFDQREYLNKEINRLRNMVGEIPEDPTVESGIHGDLGSSPGTNSKGPLSLPYARKSAEMLRAELDKDTFVRHLKERAAIAEAGAGVREKELQSVIEKLRKDNKQLAASALNVSVNDLSGLGEESKEIEKMQKLHDAEVADLKQKLTWYIENQQILEGSEAAKTALRSVIRILKAELKKRGIPVPYAASGSGIGSEMMFGDIEVDDRDLSTASSTPGKKSPGHGPSTGTTTGTSGGGGGGAGAGAGVGGPSGKPKYLRHPGDVKKIKELESILSDLQESIRKRNPDSVSNLIRAATVSDEVRAERMEQSQMIADLTAELAGVKSQYDNRLRSLRQEHEKLKLQYETRAVIKPESAVKSEGYTGRKMPTSAIKTLPNAMIKIRELEDEMEKVRTFYTKKIEDTVRKAEVQMRALKRGGGSGGGGEGVGGGEGGGGSGDGDGVAEVNESRTKSSDDVGDNDKNQSCLRGMEGLSTTHADQLLKVQSDLTAAQDEIRRLKISHSENRPPNQVVDTSLYNHETLRAAEAELLKLQYMRENEGRLQKDRVKWQDMLEERAVKDERSEAERRALKEQKDALHERVKDQEEKMSHLSAEIWRLQTLLEAPKTPQMQHFMALESHLKALEGRADRRERELRAVVEDVKATSRLEHARLQALHVQQISDKDQQLARFQSDLERLVGALKQWQATAAAAGAGAAVSKPSHPIQETTLVDNEINYLRQYGSHGIPAPGIRYM